MASLGNGQGPAQPSNGSMPEDPFTDHPGTDGGVSLGNFRAVGDAANGVGPAANGAPGLGDGLAADGDPVVNAGPAANRIGGSYRINGDPVVNAGPAANGIGGSHRTNGDPVVNAGPAANGIGGSNRTNGAAGGGGGTAPFRHPLPPRPVTPERYSRVHRSTVAVGAAATNGGHALNGGHVAGEAHAVDAGHAVNGGRGSLMATALAAEASLQAAANAGITAGPAPMLRHPRFSSLVNSVSGPLPRTSQNDSGSEGSAGFTSPAHSTIAESIRSEGRLNAAPQTAPANFAPFRRENAALGGPPPRFDLRNTNVMARGTNGGPMRSSSGSTETSEGATLVAVQPVVRPNQMLVPPPVGIAAKRSKELAALTVDKDGHLRNPTGSEAMSLQSFPFVETATYKTGPSTAAVVKITNIPFTASRAEVIALLGRNSRILNDVDEPVHIVMDRVTSKTNDAYVEFMSLNDAMRAIERHRANVAKSRPTRLGDRPVTITLSSQADLLRELFPLARGIRWNGARPSLLEPSPYAPWEFFRGFVSEEEMNMLVKHAEAPQRSPFTRECPQRPYETLISTLKKFPWYMSDIITCGERNVIFRTTLSLVRALKLAVNKHRHKNLDKQLLKRLTNAAMRCPGFTVVQKDNIAYHLGLDEVKLAEFNLPRFANSWRHLYALGPKPGAPADLVEWYIAIVREYTTILVERSDIHSRIRLESLQNQTDDYWGYMWAELQLPYAELINSMSLASLARMEMATIEKLIRWALPTSTWRG